MPVFFKNQILFLAILIPLYFTFGILASAKASEGLDRYYVRYDIKSSKNKITDERLTMVPANKDFRVEKFSLTLVSNLIPVDFKESKQTINNLAKKTALKLILEQKGLKSVKTYNHETIISYEGIIITPISLVTLTYDDDRGGYEYTAGIQFAPIAFPDRWENLQIKHRIKEFFHDFFLLFK
ncbi:MAG: hypothetical protein GY710_18075 [Desulfobacteraceae bacterium]|nr:hypothetical protein [Desulfobacteraceae bacterium]